MNNSRRIDDSAAESRGGRFRLGLAGRLGVSTVIITGLAAMAWVRESDTPTAQPQASPEPEAERESTPFGTDLKLVPDEQAMYTISHVGGSEAIDVIKKIVKDDDKRFIPVLIEMLDANDRFPLVIGAGAHRHVFALRELIDDPKLAVQNSGTLAGQWQSWYVNSKINPPAGFTAWKGRLLGRLDHRFLEFFKPDSPARIPVAEIRYGGARVDGIPPLDHPRMKAAVNADYLLPGEPVFGIEIQGDARAYPLRILDWHEVVNDDVGGIPVLLTYCTLSDAGIAYDRRAPDGKTYTFGTSGLIYHGNRLIYDHETKTLWTQFTGQPVLGSVAAADARLKSLPLVITTWESWRKSHPQTTVLDIDTGYERRYSSGAAYGDYFAGNDLRFPDVVNDARLPLKTRVFGVHQGEESVAFPLTDVVAKRVVNDVVGNTPVVLVAPEGTITVAGGMRTRRQRPFNYDAGGLVRAYERGEQQFHSGSDGSTVIDVQDRPWAVTEEALVGPAGQTLRRINGFQSWWFAWSGFNPDTAVHNIP